jgi:hypothetical protein
MIGAKPRMLLIASIVAVVASPLSRDGQVVVASATCPAGRWTDAAGVECLGPSTLGGEALRDALGTNSDGSRVVGRESFTDPDPNFLGGASPGSLWTSGAGA